MTTHYKLVGEEFVKKDGAGSASLRGSAASTPSASAIDKVKSCPCCGGESSGTGKVKYGDAFAKEQEWSQSTFYFCNCMICGVNNQGLRGYDSPAEAIAAWNRRTDPVRDELVAALEDARNYVDAVVANSGDTKRRANYRACVIRIDAALTKAGA